MATTGKTWEEQLRSVKLKKSSQPQKDYSSPKTAGYVSQEEIESYQSSVLDVNTEEWLGLLEEHTFPSRYVPMNIEDAKLFSDIYERLYANLDPSSISVINWKEQLSAKESERITNLCCNLQKTIDEFIANKETDYVFVKLSSRSPKDAPMAQSRFKKIYRETVMQEELKKKDQANEENTQIVCLLKAAFQALKVSTADEVIDACLRSERVYQDLLLALALPSRFRENWVVRQFVDIDVDMEFRGFVYQQNLTALSQYNYLIYSERLHENKDLYLKTIKTFFEENVKPKLSGFVKDYIIDFAVCEEGTKVWIIEINPFLTTTDGALFSWEHERGLLEACGSEVIFRIVEKPRPGAKAMLPNGMKELIKECETGQSPTD